MNETELNAVVELVTRQVMSALQGRGAECSPETDGFSRVLIVGEPEARLPEELGREAVLFGMEDYCGNRNILRYDRVVIAQLSTAQLADIALGRTGDDVSCAVVDALLNGIETLLLDGALSFRRYAGRGSTALYHLLESYAQTLQVFGVKPVSARPREVLPEAKPPKYQAPAVQVPRGSAVPNSGRLITEETAAALVKEGRTVRISADAIITPLARDVFSKAGVVLERERRR